MSKEYKNYIAGEWCDAQSGKRFENRNPADWDELVGTFPDSNSDDVNKAVAAANESYKEWSLVPAPIRGNMIQKAGDILVARKEEIAELMTREMGKCSQKQGVIHKKVSIRHIIPLRKAEGCLVILLHLNFGKKSTWSFGDQLERRGLYLRGISLSQFLLGKYFRR